MKNGYRWVSKKEARLEEQYKTITELRKITVKKMPPLNPRKFQALPFRTKRFWGYIDDATDEMRRRNRKNKTEHTQVFGFGFLYFVGTKEQYKKL